MNTVAKKSETPPQYAGPLVSFVYATETHLTTVLLDGRQISVPLEWFPRLQAATPAERAKWELIAGGVGIRWPDLDEDISAEGLVKGTRSGESKVSFARWLKAYRRGVRGEGLELWKLTDVEKASRKAG